MTEDFDYEEYEAKLEAIIDFAEGHSDVFENGPMFEDILDRLRTTGSLTYNQISAIDNTIAGWHIYY